MRIDRPYRDTLHPAQRLYSVSDEDLESHEAVAERHDEVGRCEVECEGEADGYRQGGQGALERQQQQHRHTQSLRAAAAVTHYTCTAPAASPRAGPRG